VYTNIEQRLGLGCTAGSHAHSQEIGKKLTNCTDFALNSFHPVKRHAS